jgi:hypothetical protein
VATLSELILRQQELIGLIKFCSAYHDAYIIELVNNEYIKILELISKEKQELISQGKNPIDFHPMSRYDINQDEDPIGYIKSYEGKLNELLNTNGI